MIQKRLNQLKKHVYIKIIKTPLISSIVYLKNSNIKIYIVNKLLFLIIFVEKNFTNFDIKKVKSTEKNMFILKLSRLRLFLA